jgi:hypothetical protein
MTYFQYKQNKYKNIKQVYNDIRYDSKKEAARAAELDLLLKAKESKRWERQVTLPLFFNDYKICGYRIDFVIWDKNDTIILEEVKGFQTDVWRLKKKLLEAILENPKSSEYKKIAEVIGNKKGLEIQYVVLM